MSKIVVITGANAGLGYFCAKFLLLDKDVSTVILACRNTKAANTAADEISVATKLNRSNIVILPEPCDLSNQALVRTYAAALKVYLDGKKISVLVNNAGIGGSTDFNKNAAGHDMIFATNHLDPDWKTGLPDPKESYPTNDEEYTKYLLNGEPLDKESSMVSGTRRYSRSKLCNVFFTNELAFRLSGELPPTLEKSVVDIANALPLKKCNTLSQASKIRVLAYHPGLMLDSNFVASSMGSVLSYIAYLLTPLLRLTPFGRLIRTTPQSGEQLAHISMGKTSETNTAQYYTDEIPTPASDFVRSERGVAVLQNELWDHSMKWANITEEELKEAGF